LANYTGGAKEKNIREKATEKIKEKGACVMSLGHNKSRGKITERKRTFRNGAINI